MNVPRIFWMFLVLFEIAFGGLVFILTRSYYMGESGATAPMLQSVPFSGLTTTTTQPLSAPPIDLQSARSPEELARLADEHFANRQYEAAAVLYEQLSTLDQANVDLRNNLAISLHYVGRSAEALDQTQRGISADASHQRIWLTRGFILAQTGQTADALTALNTAVDLNPSSDIAESARNMIADIGEL